MLLRIILKNFLSFDEEMQFDMFPNIKRTTMSDHIKTVGDVSVLKQAAIYGQNGAGKSNLVKGLEFIKEFALNKEFLKNIELDKFFFSLKKDKFENPISLLIEYANNAHFFVYSVEIGRKEICQETLSESFPTDGTYKVIFDRRGKEVSYSENNEVSEAIQTATKTLLKKNPMSSLMSLNREFPIIQDPLYFQAVDWFAHKLEIIGIHSVLPTLIDLLRTNKSIMEYSRELVPLLSLGVKDINVTDEDFDNWAQQHIQLANSLPEGLGKIKTLSLNANNTPVLSINVEDGIKKVYQLMFSHLGKDGFTGKLDASAQSDGTLRALVLIPALYFASKKGKTVVIDEINFCLSPTMVKGFVSFFAKTPETNGQLIFTTHDTQLLDEKGVLRSDEVWFVDKHNGSSVMYSHNDFKEHNTISMMRGYNEGRFGAIRFINLFEKDESEA